VKTILILTQETELTRALSAGLERARCRLIAISDRQAVLTAWRRERPDLVVVDLALPGLDGLEFCRRLRQISDVPLLVLTARVEQAEQLVAQDGCADDFVLRPFSARQVMARIQTLLHRVERRGVASPDVIQAGDLELNLAHHQAAVAGENVDLTCTELALLAALAAQPGRAFTRSQLLGAVTGNRGSSERTIDSHIRNLRTKIEPDPRHPRYVLTVHGVGYKFDIQIFS
jgi:DNA-binding response OmpR family regulator